MRSSISNSKQQHSAVLKHPRWKRTWLLAAVFLTILLASWEMYWRYWGLKPNINLSGAGVWALSRRNVSSNAAVLIGASRTLADIDQDTLSAGLHRPVVQLAMLASTPYPAFEDIASDSSFKGVVLYGIVEFLFFNEATGGRAPTHAAVRHARRATPSDHFHDVVAKWVDSIFIFRHGGLWTRTLLRRVVDPINQSLTTTHTSWNRTLSYDWKATRPIELERFKGHQKFLYSKAGMPLAEHALEQRMMQVERETDRIHRRGGQVVFIVFPTAGELESITNQRFPREKFWDRFAARTKATTIYSPDFASLRRFDPPDGSHLDMRDQVNFTTALVEILSLHIKPPI